MHTHDQHNDDHHHDHDHQHVHPHSHDHGHDGGHTHSHGTAHSHVQPDSSHDNMLQSKEEVVAFLQYTLHHNAHHEEELDGLAHSLDHLQLNKEAQEIRLCIEEIGRANNNLKAVLAALS